MPSLVGLPREHPSLKMCIGNKSSANYGSVGQDGPGLFNNC